MLYFLTQALNHDIVFDLSFSLTPCSQFKIISISQYIDISIIYLFIYLCISFATCLEYLLLFSILPDILIATLLHIQMIHFSLFKILLKELLCVAL